MASFSFCLQVLLWSISWLAISFQASNVSAEVSIFYRFAIAAMCMWFWGYIRNMLQPTSTRLQPLFALLGAFLFSFNFIAFYYSTHFIVSGLASSIMATAPIINALNMRIFLGTRVTKFFWVGAFLGFSGVACFFIPDILDSTFSFQTFIGIILSLLGTVMFSFGNIVSLKISSYGIRPFTANSYAMSYGCLFLFLIVCFLNKEFTFDPSLTYSLSLLYLAIPASVLGFTLYLKLVEMIGANHASYALVLTPLVALIFSSFFEGYNWSIYSLFGILLVAVGYKISQFKTR